MDPNNPLAGNPMAFGSVPETPQIQQMPEIPKDSHWVSILSMAVFVLLSLGAVAFLYYQNQQLKGMLASYQTIPTASPTPTATADPTANWKTYTDSKYNFSFKYPPTLSLEVNNVDTSNYTQLIFNKSLPNSFTVKALTKYPASQPKYLLDTGSTGTKNINGHNWSLFKLSDKDSGMQIEINSVLYSIIYPNSNELEINQILSTFKFSDATNNDRSQLTKYLTDQYYSQSKLYGKTQDEIVISINKLEGNYASGTGSFKTGGGDVWFATKIDGQWKIIEQTQEPPSCKLMTQYNFPKSISGECIEK